MGDPKPKVEPLETADTTLESALSGIVIRVLDLAPGGSEVRLKLPAEAQPGAPNVAEAQAKFRERLIADIDDAIALLGSSD